MPVPPLPLDWRDRLEGVLLGMAVGDALGLPREGLSRRRAARVYGGAPLRHRFFFGHGMLSDDTEHASMTAEALLESRADEARFAKALARRLRGWLLAMPAAVGWGTLRAILKLCVGFSPKNSGVFSAGNGPAMRAPIIGACLSGAPDQIERIVRTSTRMTHTDPRAEEGALAIALAAAHACRRDPPRIDPASLLSEIQPRISNKDLASSLDKVATALARGDSPERLSEALGLRDGISGYMLHTVPTALFCWLSSPGDFRRAVEGVILLGGDTDTTGAIVGGLAGAGGGARAIPEEWTQGIRDWPRSVDWLRRLGAELARSFGDGHEAEPDIQSFMTHPRGDLRLFWPAIPARNVLFLAIALVHGFRRMLPPY